METKPASFAVTLVAFEGLADWAHLIEDSGGDQGWIGDLVGALSPLKGQARLPPPHVLVLVDETTLQITGTMLVKKKGGKARGKEEALNFTRTPFSCSFMETSQSKDPPLQS